MKSFITVDVPYEKELIYTLFSCGYQIKIPYIDDNSEFIHFSYLRNSVFCLFYEFRNNPRPIRRAYIVSTAITQNNKNIISLPGINEPLLSIFVAKGHEIDSLKRAIFLLTENDKYSIYKNSIYWWYKLIGLIEYSSVKKSDLDKLILLQKRK